MIPNSVDGAAYQKGVFASVPYDNGRRRSVTDALRPRDNSQWGSEAEGDASLVLTQQDRDTMAASFGHAPLVYTSQATYFTNGGIVFKAPRRVSDAIGTMPAMPPSPTADAAA
jgi:hypothetical protein